LNRAIILFVSMLLLLVVGMVFAQEGTPDSTIPTIEIQEYEGQKLGSTKDFRENSIKGVQKADINNYRLVIEGQVEKNLSFTYDELQKMPHQKKVITLICVEGWYVTALWEGIPLIDLFKDAIAKNEANTVIFHSVDGYTTSMFLDDIRERNIMIADKINGIILPPDQGYPFILVAEEKWGYKWARWINRIELSDDPNFRGYWEKRDYSNQGDIHSPMFGD